jgi:hypothetical protein
MKVVGASYHSYATGFSQFFYQHGESLGIMTKL